MTAKQLQCKHDPMKFGEFSNENYSDMMLYAQGLEKELNKIKNEKQILERENKRLQDAIDVWH